MLSPVAYYDGFRERLLEDYEIKNRRVVAALEFATEQLAGAHRVLDVGCGIGWSTSVMADLGKDVTGLDLSQTLIETAREKFNECRFEVGDFVSYDSGSYDAVLMIDVYEHFRRSDRPWIHERIRQTGAHKVVLTVPTPQAQQFARDHGIALQPVDEDVTDVDIEKLAGDIAGSVVVNRLVTIWREHDYRHVAIEVK